MNKIILQQIITFIKNKKGSEDKGAGVAVSIITAVALGLIVYNTMTGFFTNQLFPAIIDKIMGILNTT